MKNKLWFIGLSCLWLLLPCYGAKTQGHYVSRNVEGLSSFHALVVEGKVKVDFVQQEKPAVHVSGPQQMVEQASIQVKDGKLEIQFMPQGLLSSSHELHIAVAGPALDTVHISGESEVHIRGPLKENRLALVLTGESEFAADGITVPSLSIHAEDRAEVDINRLESQQVQAKAFGRSSLELSGLALTAELENSSLGDIDAEDLRVQRGTATIHGKGDIEISAYETLSASAFGKGRIKYKGTPVSLQSSGYVQRIVPSLEN